MGARWEMGGSRRAAARANQKRQWPNAKAGGTADAGTDRAPGRAVHRPRLRPKPISAITRKPPKAGATRGHSQQQRLPQARVAEGRRGAESHIK